MASAIFSGACAADDFGNWAGTGAVTDAEALGLGAERWSGAAIALADVAGTSLGKADGNAVDVASGAPEASEVGCWLFEQAASKIVARLGSKRSRSCSMVTEVSPFSRFLLKVLCHEARSKVN